jgi:hypothetical protein
VKIFLGPIPKSPAFFHSKGRRSTSGRWHRPRLRRSASRLVCTPRAHSLALPAINRDLELEPLERAEPRHGVTCRRVRSGPPSAPPRETLLASLLSLLPCPFRAAAHDAGRNFFQTSQNR